MSTRRYALDPVALVRLLEEGVSPGPDLPLVGPTALRSDALTILLARTRARLADLEALYLDDLMRTQDAVAGLRAFLARRPPQWEHR